MASTAERIALARQQLADGNVGEAARLFRELLDAEPSNPAVITAVAAAEASQGAAPQAIARLRAAVVDQPTAAALWFFLGLMLHNTGDAAGARPALEAGLALRPTGSIDALGVLSRLAVHEHRYDDAFPLLERLLSLLPNDSKALSLLGTAHMSTGNLAAARAAIERATEFEPTGAHLFSNLASLSTYDETFSPSDVFETHRRYGRQAARDNVRMPLRTNRRPGRIRVGFVSADLRSHSVAVFFLPLLENFDRTQAEVFCYSTTEKPDIATDRLRAAAERWVDAAKVDDLRLARHIWNDDIDLLIDLGGHTGDNRLGVFAYHPARVQATWLGYPNTTGMTQIDYRITDAVADPPLEGDRAQSWHSERLLRLDGPFYCYAGINMNVEPMGPGSDDAELVPSHAAGHVTFGVPTNITKVRAPMVRIWSRLMHAVPGSHLEIIGPASDTTFVRKNLGDVFAAEGIGADRVHLLPRMPFKTYLDRHKRWDCVLDTFPFNGHTTTCHALWVGAPVVTLAGPMHASRLGASTLHFAGLGELIANTPDEFVEIARALVTDEPRLRALRSSLHDRFVASPAMNAPAFARSFERAIKQMTSTIEQ